MNCVGQRCSIEQRKHWQSSHRAAGLRGHFEQLGVPSCTDGRGAACGAGTRADSLAAVLCCKPGITCFESVHACINMSPSHKLLHASGLPRHLKHGVALSIVDATHVGFVVMLAMSHFSFYGLSLPWAGVVTNIEFCARLCRFTRCYVEWRHACASALISLAQPQSIMRSAWCGLHAQHDHT